MDNIALYNVQVVLDEAEKYLQDGLLGETLNLLFSIAEEYCNDLSLCDDVSEIMAAFRFYERERQTATDSSIAIMQIIAKTTQVKKKIRQQIKTPMAVKSFLNLQEKSVIKRGGDVNPIGYGVQVGE